MLYLVPIDELGKVLVKLATLYSTMFFFSPKIFLLVFIYYLVREEFPKSDIVPHILWRTILYCCAVETSYYLLLV